LNIRIGIIANSPLKPLGHHNSNPPVRGLPTNEVENKGHTIFLVTFEIEDASHFSLVCKKKRGGAEMSAPCFANNFFCISPA
jgi:hypothetical protein